MLIRQITPQTLNTTQHIRQNLDTGESVIDLSSPQDSSVINLTFHRSRPQKTAEHSTPQTLQQQTLSASYSPSPAARSEKPVTVGTAQSFQTTIYMDESASSEAEGGPNFAAMYGIMPQTSGQTGTGTVFHDPDALAFQQFLEKTRMIGIADDKAQELLHRSRMILSQASSKGRRGYQPSLELFSMSPRQGLRLIMWRRT